MKKFFSVLLVIALLTGVLSLPAASALPTQVYHVRVYVTDDGVTFPFFTADGNPAFCLIPPADAPPTGIYTVDDSDWLPRGAGYDLLIKCAYYLYHGPGWDIHKYNLFGSNPDTPINYDYSHHIMAYVWSGDPEVAFPGFYGEDVKEHLKKVADKSIAGLPMPPAGFDVFVYNKNASGQTILSWIYQPTGNLEIIKTTQNNNGIVSGFQFRVTKQDGTPVGTYISDSAGRVYIPDLLQGWYTVEEINLSNEFVPPTTNPVAVEVKSGETATVYFNNIKKLGVILVQKTNPKPDMGDYSLAGAKFTIKDADGAVVDTVTTGADGKGQSIILPLGTYTVQETSAPYGFVLNPASFPVVLSGDLGPGPIVYYTLVVPNDPQTGKVTIEKTGEQLAGADLIDEDWWTHYVPRYEARPLPGAVYEIYVRSDIKTWDGRILVSNGVTMKAGALVDTITTGADGKAVSKELPLGDYYAVEITAPFGMVLNAEEHDFSFVYGGQEISIVVSQVGVYNERQKAEVSLIKWCETPNKPPQGYNPFPDIVFGLFAREDILAYDGSVAIPQDGLLEYITPGSDGTAAFLTDLPLGSYYVKEVKTGEKYYLDDTEYDFVFSYAGQDTATVVIPVNDGVPMKNWLKGSMTISKDIARALNYEHSTGAGFKMSDLGIKGGQQWEEYTPINVGAVNSGSFKADIITEKQRYKVGDMTAEFTDSGDLVIKYKCLPGLHLQQGARLEIFDDPGLFTSDARGDLPFLSVNQNYAGATEGWITVPAADLIARGIDRFNDDQEFYVFLRLDRVAGGIYTNENRSWLESGYIYEFMVFDLNDFDGKGYANQKAIEKAVQTDVNGVLAKGIQPVEHLFCKMWESVTFDLPAGKTQSAGKYLVAEIFRDADGNIIDNPSFVNVNGIDGVFTINPDKETKVPVKNDFKIFRPKEEPSTYELTGVTMTGTPRAENLMRFSADVTGDTASLKYSFYVTKNDGKTYYLSSVSYRDFFDYVTQTAGLYSVDAYCMDAQGRKATVTITAFL